ncbi:MAG: methyltransferase domain-containing protein [Candidatus Aminicenantes bacterium]|nr:MAG: methyltransferase domain-containing protein [Candidatus Aminicenantes bacterium]
MTSDGEIICPNCKYKLLLETKGNDYFCPRCNKIYPHRNGIISFVDENEEKVGYKNSYFFELREVEDKHFWFKARKKLILYCVKKYCQRIINSKHKMLEIGCGNGSVLQYLKENGIDCQGGDLFIEGLKIYREMAEVPLYQVDALNLPFREYFDIIGLFDVIEHIDEDRKVLKEAYKALKSNGKILITVPTYKKLWGRYDKLSFHKRRYSKTELIIKLRNAGFAIEKISYFVSLIFPVLLLFRYFHNIKGKNQSDEEFLKKEIQIMPLLNRVFLWILEIEIKLINLLHFPFGSSLLAIARKGKSESRIL